MTTNQFRKYLMRMKEKISEIKAREIFSEETPFNQSYVFSQGKNDTHCISIVKFRDCYKVGIENNVWEKYPEDAYLIVYVDEENMPDIYHIVDKIYQACAHKAPILEDKKRYILEYIEGLNEQFK